jgi:glycosyltransferase involved in cell wall biosynthesis
MLGSVETLQIGLIASPHQTSGSDRYYFELLRALRGRDQRVAGIVLGDPGTIEAAAGGVRSFAPEGSRALRRWRGLRRQVRAMVRSADVVVSHLAAHVFPALDIIRAKPLVEHFHGPWALEGRFDRIARARVALRFVQERSVYRRAERIVVLSRAFGDVLEREYRMPAHKLRVIPGGVDLARFDSSTPREAARAELGLGADRPIVFCVRRLEPTKGIDRLIEAIDLVRVRVPDVLAVVAGTGGQAADLQRLVRERGLERHVAFAGKIDDRRLALYYRAADCSVVPSVAWEGFGLVCIESFASGTPVMVTPVGGLPEAAGGLDPALVFASASVADIAAGLSDALRGRRPLPSEAACLAYAQRFAWPAIAARVAEVYREVA